MKNLKGNIKRSELIKSFEIKSYHLPFSSFEAIRMIHFDDGMKIKYSNYICFISFYNVFKEVMDKVEEVNKSITTFDHYKTILYEKFT